MGLSYFTSMILLMLVALSIQSSMSTSREEIKNDLSKNEDAIANYFRNVSRLMTRLRLLPDSLRDYSSSELYSDVMELRLAVYRTLELPWKTTNFFIKMRALVTREVTPDTRKQVADLAHMARRAITRLYPRGSNTNQELQSLLPKLNAVYGYPKIRAKFDKDAYWHNTRLLDFQKKQLWYEIQKIVLLKHQLFFKMLTFIEKAKGFWG